MAISRNLYLAIVLKAKLSCYEQFCKRQILRSNTYLYRLLYNSKLYHLKAKKYGILRFHCAVETKTKNSLQGKLFYAI